MPLNRAHHNFPIQILKTGIKAVGKARQLRAGSQEGPSWSLYVQNIN